MGVLSLYSWCLAPGTYNSYKQSVKLVPSWDLRGRLGDWARKAFLGYEPHVISRSQPMRQLCLVPTATPGHPAPCPSSALSRAAGPQAPNFDVVWLLSQLNKMCPLLKMHPPPSSPGGHTHIHRGLGETLESVSH